MITSVSNNIVKLVMSLHHKKGRNEQNLYIAEGIHPVTEALKAGVSIHRFIWTKKMSSSLEGATLLEELNRISTGIEVDEIVFKKISETDTPQGIIAILEIPREDEMNFSQISLGLIVDGVQDPGNVGTMIRTAWAADLDCIFFTSGAADPYQGKVVRATMGGVFNQKLYRNLTPGDISKKADEYGITIIAGYPDAMERYYDLDLKRPTLFLVGNEGKGVHQDWTNRPIQKVVIPQPGKAESLNVSVSAGILIYEAIRQRMIL